MQGRQLRRMWPHGSGPHGNGQLTVHLVLKTTSHRCPNTQRYLAHKKRPPPRTLQWDYLESYDGPRGGGLFLSEVPLYPGGGACMAAVSVQGCLDDNKLPPPPDFRRSLGSGLL